MRPLRKHYMLVATVGLLGLLAALWLAVSTSPSVASDALWKAVLAESWMSVIDLCEAKEDTPMPVHLRALKGHACLALNRNDESLVCLITIAEKSDRLTWKEWAFQFAGANPRNTMALYLKGDALSRLGKWDEAVTVYSEALSQAKTQLAKAMVLNAMGVACVYLDNATEAMKDFEKACATAPSFADAHANLGTLLLVAEAAEGASTKYDEAIHQSESFTLARIGRTCAMLGQSRDPETLTRAIEEFLSWARRPCASSLAKENLESLARASKEAGESQITVSKGMSLSANEFREMDRPTRMEIMSKMSPQQLNTLISKSYENYAHSRSWGESLQYLGPLSDLVPGFSATQSHRHADQHMEVFSDARSVMQQNFGINQSSWFRDSGGADTKGVAFNESLGDMGPWPAKKMWFGLMPAVGLPRVTFMDAESTEP